MANDNYVTFKINWKAVALSSSFLIPTTTMTSALVYLALVLLHVRIEGSAGSHGTTPQDALPHVCIIGGGIAGASTSHFLTETKEQHIRVTIFERTNRLGGRISTVPLDLSNGSSIEAGASIIAARNRLMTHFTQLLKLKRQQPDSDEKLALWDGESYRMRLSSYASITVIRMLFRYGLSIFRMRTLVNELLSQFDKLYPTTWHISALRAASDVERFFVPTASLFDLTQKPFGEMARKYLSDRFIDEMAGAISRCNYNQDPYGMNALAGAVSLAGSGGNLWRVHGGNVRVVEGLIARSGAKVELKATISRISRAKNGGYVVSGAKQDWNCNAVVIAAPLELASMSLPDDITALTKVGRTFRRTVATFVTGMLNNGTFGEDTPNAVLTTVGTERMFSSVSRVYKFANGSEIYKVFSSEELGEKELARIFKTGSKVLASYPWYAYPKFSAPETFAPFDIDKEGALCYTSPIESAGSAMEMSALSGANCAAIIWKRLQLPIWPLDAAVPLKDEL